MYAGVSGTGGMGDTYGNFAIFESGKLKGVVFQNVGSRPFAIRPNVSDERFHDLSKKYVSSTCCKLVKNDGKL